MDKQEALEIQRRLYTRIKFRQAIYVDGKFHRFAYWGFVNEKSYYGPTTGNTITLWEAHDNSEQCTGEVSLNGELVFEGDILINFNITLEGSTLPKPFAVRYRQGQFVAEAKDGQIILAHLFKKCNVIGDIHSSPQYLTDEPFAIKERM